jgi:hypothetical protein
MPKVSFHFSRLLVGFADLISRADDFTSASDLARAPGGTPDGRLLEILKELVLTNRNSMTAPAFGLSDRDDAGGWRVAGAVMG